MRWEIRVSTTELFENQNGSSLTHYGVLGMKWGVRKDRPLKRRKSKKLNAVRKTRKTENGDSVVRINDAEIYAKIKSIADEYSDLTPASYASKGEALYKMTNLSNFNARLSEEQQRQAVNHGAETYERTVNCFECAMAYEMRRRGYNVQANEIPGGFGFEVLHAFDVKDSFNVKVSSPKNLQLNSTTLAEEAYRRMEEQCLSYGNGARGMVAIQYAEPYDGGHAMNWVVENGEFKIIDNQSGNMTGYETFLYCDADVDVYRLDNTNVLPGVTDFVETFEATDKEKNDAKKRYKRMKEVWKKEGYADEYKESGKKAVEKAIKNIGKNISDFVSKGVELISNFLKNPFGVQKNESTTSGKGWLVRK